VTAVVSDGGFVSLVDRFRALLNKGVDSGAGVDEGGVVGITNLPQGLEDPVLVTITASVRTKARVAMAAGRHDTIGVDLVAAAVNELVTVGAHPLLVTPDFACGKLADGIAESVVLGLVEGCRQVGCSLGGGGFLELGGVMADGAYEITAVASGAACRHALLGPDCVLPGDHLVAIAARGLHTAGNAVARRVFEQEMCLWLGEEVSGLGCSVAEALLAPTHCYAAAARALLAGLGEDLHALGNVAEGGIQAALVRMLPGGWMARVDLASYERPELFRVIAQGGKLDEEEMRSTFNLGVGFVACVAPGRSLEATEILADAGETAWVFGEVRARTTEPLAPVEVSFLPETAPETTSQYPLK
jgi:phosphoribosylformylglycinamidine cyclo-ligase